MAERLPREPERFYCRDFYLAAFIHLYTKQKPSVRLTDWNRVEFIFADADGAVSELGQQFSQTGGDIVPLHDFRDAYRAVQRCADRVKGFGRGYNADNNDD